MRPSREEVRAARQQLREEFASTREDQATYRDAMRDMRDALREAGSDLRSLSRDLRKGEITQEEYEAAQAEVEALRAMFEQKEDELKAALDDLKEAKADLRQAYRDYAKGDITLEEFEAAKADLDAAGEKVREKAEAISDWENEPAPAAPAEPEPSEEEPQPEAPDEEEPEEPAASEPAAEPEPSGEEPQPEASEPEAPAEEEPAVSDNEDESGEEAPQDPPAEEPVEEDNPPAAEEEEEPAPEPEPEEEVAEEASPAPQQPDDDPNTYTSGLDTPDGFNIDITFTGGGWSDSLKEAFYIASELISDIITSDVGDVYYNGEMIDDLSITAEMSSIDGLYGVLGYAGISAIRNPNASEDPYLPVAGFMSFDTADANHLMSSGDWNAVVLHEMMHTLGVGTLWDYMGLLSNADGDLRFTGENATAAYQQYVEERGISDSGAANGVIVEEGGGSGTARSHWDEDVFEHELMTGWLSGDMHLSDVTIASLEDLGYETVWDPDGTAIA